MRKSIFILACVMVCAMAQQRKKPLAAAAKVVAPEPPQEERARVLELNDRTIPVVNVRVWRETLLMIPADEKIVKVGTGDYENFKPEWHKGGRTVSVKPAVESHDTNLNIMTESSAVYSVILREVTKCPSCKVDLKVFIEDPERAAQKKEDEDKREADSEAKLKRELADMMVAVSSAKAGEAAAIAESKKAKADALIEIDKRTSEFRERFISGLNCHYRFRQNKGPFWVGGICTDGTFTYIQSRSMGVESIYAQKPDGISLVQYDYRRGTGNHEGVYVVTGVLTKGYLQAGKKQHFKFEALPPAPKANGV